MLVKSTELRRESGWKNWAGGRSRIPLTGGTERQWGLRFRARRSYKYARFVEGAAAEGDCLKEPAAKRGGFLA